MRPLGRLVIAEGVCCAIGTTVEALLGQMYYLQECVDDWLVLKMTPGFAFIAVCD